MLPELLPGFVGRTQQKEMIRFIAQVLASGGHGVCQAPTGTGKSFGYQIPAIVLALSRDKRVVISTETAALQDQIAGKDLVLLTQILERLGIAAPSIVVKGRERYICPLRLNEKTTQGVLLDDDGAQAEMVAIAKSWHGGEWDGLRDSLPVKVPDAIWMRVNNNRHMCTNDRCPEAPGCPHMAVKNAVKTARIIVTNHSYLLSTIAVQGGGESTGPKNPVVDFDNNFYLFDEAHHIHDRCIEAFASSAVIDEDIMNEAGRMLAALDGSSGAVLRLRAEAFRGIGVALRSNFKTLLGSGSRHRFLLGKVPDVFANLVEEYAASLGAICDLIGQTIDTARKKTNRASLTVLIANANAMLGQLKERQDAMDRFCADSSTPQAKWIAMHRDECTLHVAPFAAAPLAKSMLWDNMKGVALCSATIASFGEFTATLANLGMPKTTRTQLLSSPLDYSRASMRVPRFMVGANTPGYAMMVPAMVRKLAFSGEHKGSLVYFTSRRQMEATYASLSAEERTDVIMQGHLSPTAMITEHKRRIDAGGRSILFGMNSISEGVDLPGKYLTLVIADKLPFPSLDDPILAAHVEHLEAKGLSAFPLLMLPMAGIRLAQVAGRLIRTETDWGVFYVLDRRLVEKTYGAKLQKSTPFNSVLEC